MGLKVGELFATLGLETGGFDKGLAGAEKSMNSAAKNMSSTGLKLTLGLTAPLVALGKGVFGAAMKWESAFTGVKKTIDGTEAEFAALESGIINMSKELPASAVEIAGVAEAAGQLGVAKEDILGFSKIMIDLGETTNLTADDAATMLAQFANVTQTVAKNGSSAYSRLGSVVVALGNEGASTEAQIVSMGQRIAGAGTQLGMTDAQIMGLASALASVGVDAEAGGSSMSTFLSEMNLAVSNGGKDLKKFAKVAGISTDEFSKLFKEDAAGALNMFVKGLGAAEDPVKALSDMGINEIRMRDALLRLAGAGDLLTESFATANRAWDENTALSDEAAQRYKTMESVLALVKNNVTELARQLGDALAPYVMEAAKWVRKLTTFLQGLSPEVKEGAVKIGLLAAAIGPGMLAVSKLMKLMGGGAGFAKVFKLALSPVGLLAGGLFALYKLSPKVRSAFGKMAKFGKTFFKALSNGTSISDSLGYSVAKVFGGAAYKKYSAVMGKLGRAWSTTVTWLKNTGEGLSKAWNEGSAEGGIFGGIAAAAKYIFPRIKSAFEGGWETVKGAAATLGGKAMEALGTALSGTSFAGFGKALIEGALALQEGETIDFSGIMAALKTDFTAWTNETLLPWVQSIDWAAVWSAFWYRLCDLTLWLSSVTLPSAGFVLGKMAALVLEIGKGLNAAVAGLFVGGNGGGEPKTATQWLDTLFGEGTSTALAEIGARFWELVYQGFTGSEKSFGDLMTTVQRSFDEWLAKLFGQEGQPIPVEKWTASEIEIYGQTGVVPVWGGEPVEVEVPAEFYIDPITGEKIEVPKEVTTLFTDPVEPGIVVEVPATVEVVPATRNNGSSGVVFPDNWTDKQVEEYLKSHPKDATVEVPITANPVVKPGVKQPTFTPQNGAVSLFTAADAGAAQSGAILSGAYKTGYNFSAGFANGIAAGTKLIITASIKAALAAKLAMERTLGIASPSKVAFKSGGFFTEGFVDGILSLVSSVARAGKGVALAATGGLAYTPVSRRAPTMARSASSGASLDMNRLAAMIAARPAVLRINDKVIARATVDANMSAQAERDARLSAGYGV